MPVRLAGKITPWVVLQMQTAFHFLPYFKTKVYSVCFKTISHYMYCVHKDFKNSSQKSATITVWITLRIVDYKLTSPAKKVMATSVSQLKN